MTLQHIGARKLSLYFKDRITDEVFSAFSSVLEQNITQTDIEDSEKGLTFRTEQEKNIFLMTKDNIIARTCIELALFEYTCPISDELLRLIIPDYKKGISLRLCMYVLGMDTVSAYDKGTEAYFTIKHILSQTLHSSDIFDIFFSADTTFVSILNDSYIPASELIDMSFFSVSGDSTEKMILWESEAHEMAQCISSVNSAVAVIYGDLFSGRRFFAQYTASLCNLSTMTVDFKYFLSADDDKVLDMRIQSLVRDCFMLRCALCISQADQNEIHIHGQHSITEIIKSIADRFSFSSLPLFITADPKTEIIPFIERAFFTFTIPKLNSYQSIVTWKYFSEKISDTPYYTDVADKIILSVGNIKKAVIMAHAENVTNDPHRLSELCYSVMEDNGKGIKRIYPKYTFDDIKLAETEKNTLIQICNHVKYQNSIFDEWGMKKSYPYGSCVSVLFTGPPGTGKTMAAHVIANALNLALFRIDISQVMDKYIGETEKHLEEIFEKAEKGNMILFLDEADSLIGKRNEITSSNDKFANNEVSFILQRIEDFDGIIIMATNFSNNIDPAFLRRIRYVSEFSLPDKHIRREIWESLFNDGIPHEDIDFELLSSDEFEFTGAVIKNIVLNSAIRAYAENAAVGMRHVGESIKEEFRKMGRTVEVRISE